MLLENVQLVVDDLTNPLKKNLKLKRKMFHLYIQRQDLWATVPVKFNACACLSEKNNRKLTKTSHDLFDLELTHLSLQSSII